MLAVLKNNMLNKKGVTLIEVMIALVVLLLVFMGLLQTAILSIQSNTTNLMRDEMKRVTAQIASDAKVGTSFDLLADNPVTIPLLACTTPPVSDPGLYAPTNISFRNMQANVSPGFNCGWRLEVIDRLDPKTLIVDTKQIKITVRCEFKNECYTQSFTTMRRR